MQLGVTRKERKRRSGRKGEGNAERMEGGKQEEGGEGGQIREHFTL